MQKNSASSSFASLIATRNIQTQISHRPFFFKSSSYAFRSKSGATTNTYRSIASLPSTFRNNGKNGNNLLINRHYHSSQQKYSSNDPKQEQQQFLPREQQSSSSGGVSGWIPYHKWRSSTVSSTSEYILHETQVMAQYLKRAQKFQRLLVLAVGSIAGLSIVALYNWDTVKQRVGQEGVEVIREGIKSEDLQLSAADFSKALLNEILNDDKLIGDVSQWAMKVLEESKSDLSTLVVQVLQTKPVVDECQRISNSIVNHLCSQSWVQEKVGELLIAAIQTEYSRNCAAQWTIDLLNRDDVMESIQAVVNQSVLNEPTVRAEVAKLANAVVTEVLQDPRTIQLSQDHISAVLNAPEFQDYAGGAAWNIVRKALSPRWLGGPSPHITTTPPGSQKIVPSSPAASTLHEAQFDQPPAVGTTLIQNASERSTMPAMGDAKEAKETIMGTEEKDLIDDKGEEEEDGATVEELKPSSDVSLPEDTEDSEFVPLFRNEANEEFNGRAMRSGEIVGKTSSITDIDNKNGTDLLLERNGDEEIDSADTTQELDERGNHNEEQEEVIDEGGVMGNDSNNDNEVDQDNNREEDSDDVDIATSRDVSSLGELVQEEGEKEKETSYESPEDDDDEELYKINGNIIMKTSEVDQTDDDEGPTDHRAVDHESSVVLDDDDDDDDDVTIMINH